ncbi:MAG: response regulator, partial [Myxococcota bacterium]
RRKVMILDDNILDVIRAEESLRPAGYDVVILLSSHGAFAKLDYERPEILLIELNTRRLNTLGLLDAIRASPELDDLVVVLFSSLDAEFLQQWCIEHDIHGYYSKSMDISKIPDFLDNFYED